MKLLLGRICDSTRGKEGHLLLNFEGLKCCSWPLGKSFCTVSCLPESSQGLSSLHVSDGISDSVCGSACVLCLCHPRWTVSCHGCMLCCWSSWPENGAFSLAHILLGYIPSVALKKLCHHLPVCFGPEEEITWTDEICFLTAPLQKCIFRMLRSFFLSLSRPGELLIFGRNVYSGSGRKRCGEDEQLFIDQKRWGSSCMWWPL